MKNFDRSTIERHLIRLPERDLVALVDDLWSARGYQTVRDGLNIVATRDSHSVRIHVIGSIPWQLDDRRAAAGDADIIVIGTDVGVSVPNTNIIDVIDLANILAYGVNRTTAQELCVYYFGAPPDRLSPPLIERSVRRIKHSPQSVALVAAVSVVIIVVVASIGGPLVEPSNTTDSPDTPVASTAGSASPLPAGDGPPPGISNDTVTDINALADTHAKVLSRHSHTVWYNRYQPQNLDPNKTRVQRGVKITAESNRYLVKTTSVVSGNETYIKAIYAEDGVIYAADWNETTHHHERVLRVDRRNVLIPTAPDLRKNLVMRYLSTPRTNVTETIKRDEVTAYRVVGQGAPNSSELGEVRRYSVVALVDSRGFVRNLNIQYVSVLPNSEYRVSINITYGRIGETKVAPPAWLENRTHSKQDPSGANRPL